MPINRSQPGSSRERPFPAYRPSDLKSDERYQGWRCTTPDCSKRIELVEALSDTVEPAQEHDRIWMECAYCGGVDLYRHDAKSIETHRATDDDRSAPVGIYCLHCKHTHPNSHVRGRLRWMLKHGEPIEGMCIETGNVITASAEERAKIANALGVPAASTRGHGG